MFLQQFYNTLLSVNRERKSGKIYIYVREGSSKRSGTILVGQGEILGINYSQETNEAALEKMLSLGVEEVVFMPHSDVDSSDKESDAPSILSVLKNIRLLSDGITNAVDPHEIRQEVEVLLKKIYGPGIVKEIDKIAESYPIDQNPGNFLDQCKEKALLMLSKDQVEIMFRSLYEKINL
ncbi:MAG: hypothetical protein IPM89_10095 [Candidatus Competibacteraceae bacterium]|nr:MAG: hypothetical protein IPM89_10095 [Candidatus Competibacteraceae bacterium]